MLLKIPGNVREDSGKCSRKFWEILSILNWSKPIFTWNKVNVKWCFEAWLVFAISKEEIERSNKIIWYYHFF